MPAVLRVSIVGGAGYGLQFCSREFGAGALVGFSPPLVLRSDFVGRNFDACITPNQTCVVTISNLIHIHQPLMPACKEDCILQILFVVPDGHLELGGWTLGAFIFDSNLNAGMDDSCESRAMSMSVQQERMVLGLHHKADHLNTNTSEQIEPSVLGRLYVCLEEIYKWPTI